MCALRVSRGLGPQTNTSQRTCWEVFCNALAASATVGHDPIEGNRPCHREARDGWLMSSLQRCPNAVRCADTCIHVGHRCSRGGVTGLFKLPLGRAEMAFARWMGWPQRCRITVFLDLRRDGEAACRGGPGINWARVVQRADRVGDHEDPITREGGVRVQVAGAVDGAGSSG